MINPMQQVVIALRKRDSEAVITTLQNIGVLHLKAVDQDSPLKQDALVTEDAQERREDERLLARVESTLSELDVASVTPVAVPEHTQWNTIVEAAAEPVAQLAKERQELLSDIEADRTYGATVHALSRMANGADKSKRLALLPFLMPSTEETTELENALNADLAERYALSVETVGTSHVGLIAVLQRDHDHARAAMSKARIGELRLPGRFDHMHLSEAASAMEEISRHSDSQTRDLQTRRDQLINEYAAQLFAIRDALKDRVALHDVRNVSAQGKYSMVMQGYFPTDRVDTFKNAMNHFGEAVSYEIHDVDEHHDQHVPVELKNNSYVKPFQLIMGLMSTPKYGTFDPTWIIAVFMPLFFGIIMADIAYGLMFFAFGMWCISKGNRNEGLNLSFMGAYVPPVTMSNLGYVTNVMALWTVIWGVLTGEFFGTLLEHQHIFYFDPVITERLWGWTNLLPKVEGHHYGLIPILFPRLETEYFSNMALVFALCFGIVQVLWGWAIRTQQGIKHNDRVHTWEGLAMLGGVSGIVLTAFATKATQDLAQMSNFSNPLTIGAWIGFALLIVGYSQVFRQFPLLPIEAISQGGAIMSYARIFAVGLVSAILAKLSTNLGWHLHESMGPLGTVLGLIIGAFIHLFVLALTLIGHILQPIRLHMLEFLNPTGFNTETSPAYNPLRRLSPIAQQGQVK